MVTSSRRKPSCWLEVQCWDDADALSMDVEALLFLSKELFHHYFWIKDYSLLWLQRVVIFTGLVTCLSYASGWLCQILSYGPLTVLVAGVFPCFLLINSDTLYILLNSTECMTGWLPGMHKVWHVAVLGCGLRLLCEGCSMGAACLLQVTVKDGVALVCRLWGHCAGTLWGYTGVNTLLTELVDLELKSITWGILVEGTASVYYFVFKKIDFVFGNKNTCILRLANHSNWFGSKWVVMKYQKRENEVSCLEGTVNENIPKFLIAPSWLSKRKEIWAPLVKTHNKGGRSCEVYSPVLHLENWENGII